MADKNIVALTAVTDVADTDIVYVVRDPGGTPLDHKITGANLKAALNDGKVAHDGTPLVGDLVKVKSLSPLVVEGLDSAAYVAPDDDAATLGSGAADDGHVLTADGAGGAMFEAAAGGGATAKNSVEVDTGDIQLVGDTLTPGNDKVYGTSGTGVKGWKDDPAGGGGALADNLVASVSGLHPEYTTGYELGVSRDGVSNTLDTTALEGPGGYVWEHLGVDTWSRGNDGVILSSGGEGRDGGVVFPVVSDDPHVLSVTVDPRTTVGSVGLFMRYLDADNWVGCRLTRSGFSIEEKVDGTISSIASTSTGWSALRFALPLRIQFGFTRSNTVSGGIFLNTNVGIALRTAAVTFPGTKWGLWTNQAASRFRNIHLERGFPF